MKHTLYIKEGCYFCAVMKQSLEELGLDFEIKDSTSGAAPKLVLNNEVIFVGLPHYKKLIEYVNDYTNN